MDKNEYNLKLEEIDRYISQGMFSEAAQVADTIDWRRVRNVRTLCMISEVYEADGRYEDSKALLLRAYRRSPVGRGILYRLVEVTIALKQFDEAIEYYSEYVQAAPNDNNKYILKYKIYRGRGSSLDEQIEILKQYLEQEYNEKWVYELAKLYQQAGKIQECLATCDDLVLWFHSGKYVIKALELKRKYAALTPKQQEIYDHRFDEPEEDDYIGESLLSSEKTLLKPGTDDAEMIAADAEREIAEAVGEAVSETPFGMTDVSGEENAEEAAEVIEEEVTENAEEAAEVIEEEVNENAEEAAEVIEEEVTENAEDAAEVIEEEVAENAEEAAEVIEEEVTENAEEDAESIHSDMVKSMREIVAGVVREPEVSAEAEAADAAIEESKAELQARAEEEDAAFRIPQQQEKVQAGQLSIDDILLSMGERGTEVREAASRAVGAGSRDENMAGSASGEPEGVVSAIDEALMSMGVERTKPADEKPADGRDDLLPGEDIALRAEAEAAAASVKEAFGEGEEEAPEDKDILTAATRVIPTEEIAAAYAKRPLDMEEEKETAAEAGEEAGAEEGAEAEAEAGEEAGVEAGEEAGAEADAEALAGAEADAETGEEAGAQTAGSGLKVRPEHRSMFEGFLEIGGLDEQIAAAILNAEQKPADRTSREGNILIFGDHGCGKTTIATGIAKAIAMDRGSQYLKMARIYAADLNRKDIPATIAKIAGGILIIEEAGDLDDQIIDQLTTAMEFRTDGMIMILEDERRYIHDKLMRHPRFTMKFTSQIYIPTFTIDELVHFGEIYAAGRDYSLSDGAAEALYDRIGSVSAQGDAISITNVIELVDRAIGKANSFGRKLGGKKRYDENDCIILLDKDFKK